MADFDKVIPPGQEGNIKMVVEGKKVHGAFVKDAVVHSNDPESPQVTISLAGNEKSYLNISPAGRIYLQGMYDEPVNKTLSIMSNEPELDFKVTGVSSNIDDKITYRLEPGSVPGEFLVHVFKNPRLPTLNTFGTLFIQTNSANAGTSDVQIQVVTKGTISVQPSVVNFGNVQFGEQGRMGDELTRTFTVLKSRGEFKISGLTSDNPNYHATIEEVVPGQRYKVDVTFQAPALSQERQNELGELTLQTTDPLEPVLKVRLIARAQ